MCSHTPWVEHHIPASPLYPVLCTSFKPALILSDYPNFNHLFGLIFSTTNFITWRVIWLLPLLMTCPNQANSFYLLPSSVASRMLTGFSGFLVKWHLTVRNEASADALVLGRISNIVIEYFVLNHRICTLRSIHTVCWKAYWIGMISFIS